MTLQIVLNGLDLTGLDSFGAQWSIDSFTGWGATKPSVSPVVKPRQRGAWAGFSAHGPRHVVISGQVAAPDQDSLTYAIDGLINSSPLGTVTMQVTENDRTRYLAVRLEDEVIWTYISDKMASWSVALIALDPRKTGAVLTSNTALPSTSGGATVPFTLPLVMSAQIITGSVALTNPGNDTGEVLLRIDGPCTGPVITHTSSSTTTSLIFASNLTLGSGEFLLIDMDKKTALANGQSSRSGYITSRGWSGFDPGINVWSFTAAVFDPASLLTVWATPSWR